MAAPGRTLRARWLPKLAIIALTGAAGFVSANLGWINVRAWPLIGSAFTKGKAASSVPVRLVGVEPDLELPEELAAAQYEPESDLDDVDGPPGGAPEHVRTVGFDEDEPAVEASVESGRGAAGATKTAQNADNHKARPDAARTQPARHSVEGQAARGRPLVAVETIDEWIEAGEYLKAQQELSRWYWQKPAARARILPQLNKMSQAIFFARQPNFHETYTVQPGDQLRAIGRDHHVPWEYVARLNRVDARKIRSGQKLKIVPGPFAAVVFLDRFELVVHLDGTYVKSYRIGIGKDDSTPTGTYSVQQKLVDPTYYGPDGVIRHDDPMNPLGERWIDLGDSYGIHGTIEPESIGKAESRGCIRMLNPDVEEVYNLLIVGSFVRIER